MPAATGSEGAGASGHPALELAHPWVRRLLRLGFVARGVIYSLVGLFTLWSLAQDGKGAHGGVSHTLNSIHSVKPGIVLLGGLAVGFAGYAIGMIWTSLFDWNFEGKSALGLARRTGVFIIGLAHLSLTASVVLIIAGREAEGGGTRRWTTRALGHPFGREGVGIGGLCAIGYGIFCFSKIWTGKLDPLLDLSSLPRGRARVISWVGRFGMLARGIIYVTIGVVLTMGAVRDEASNIVGLGGAMRTVSDDPYGAASLAFVAAGLVAYGVFMFTEARYRRIGERARVA